MLIGGYKVQAQVQSDEVRVTGKKRDELQIVMALVREADLGQPLQFKNFRDETSTSNYSEPINVIETLLTQCLKFLSV